MFMRVAVPEFGPFALIEIRVVIASLFLLPIWYFREAKQSWPVVKRKWKFLLVLGTFNSAAPFSLFAFSTLFVTGGLASILNSTTPIWGAIVAFVWLRKTLAWDGVLGLALGMLGVSILASGSIAAGVPGAALGMAAGVAAAFMYGIAANYAAENITNISPLSVATFSLVAASIVLIPFTLATFPEEPVSIQAWSAVLAMGVFSTGLANILYFHLLEQVGATKAMTVAYLIPVFGTLWGAIFLQEQITQTMVIGAAVVLLGISLVTGVISFSKKAD